MEVLENLKNLKIYDSTMFHLEDTMDAYRKYIELLKTLDIKHLYWFLETLKKREIVNNQETEMENTFLMELFSNIQKTNSIDYVVQAYRDGKIDIDEVRRLHRIVINGTIDDKEENYDYRSDNDKWVGHFGSNNEKVIEYMPPDYTKVKDYMLEILRYLNFDCNTIFDNIFLKPFVIHALIAYLQPFGNGNTRLARLIQHGKIWQSTVEQYDVKLEMPAIYVSKNYLLTRKQYRGLISNIAVVKDDNAWNKWFNYNLNMVDEQLYRLGIDLDTYVNSINRISTLD